MKEFPKSEVKTRLMTPKEAVENGQFRDGKHHYDAFGKNENRKGLDEWKMS